MIMICGNCVDTLDNLVNENSVEAAKNFLPEVLGNNNVLANERIYESYLPKLDKDLDEEGEGGDIMSWQSQHAQHQIQTTSIPADLEAEALSNTNIPILHPDEDPQRQQFKQLKGYMYCVTCGGRFYGEEMETIPSKTNRAGWQCPVCKVCQGCRQNTEEDKMIICDKCDGAFHMDCLSPKLLEVPQVEEWFCPNCDPDGKKYIVYSQDVKDVYLNGPYIEFNRSESENDEAVKRHGGQVCITEGFERTAIININVNTTNISMQPKHEKILTYNAHNDNIQNKVVQPIMTSSNLDVKEEIHPGSIVSEEQVRISAERNLKISESLKLENTSNSAKNW